MEIPLGQSLTTLSAFFVQNANLWKDHYDVANKVFQNACQAEIDLWGTALHPGVV